MRVAHDPGAVMLGFYTCSRRPWSARHGRNGPQLRGRPDADSGRLKAAAALAVNAAIRASDCICAADLGYHSAAASHAAAIDLLRQVPDPDDLVRALSSALSLKSLFNYQHGHVDSQSVTDVIEDAERLLRAAARRAEAAGSTRDADQADHT